MWVCFAHKHNNQHGVSINISHRVQHRVVTLLPAPQHLAVLQKYVFHRVTNEKD